MADPLLPDEKTDPGPSTETPIDALVGKDPSDDKPADGSETAVAGTTDAGAAVTADAVVAAGEEDDDDFIRTDLSDETVKPFSVQLYGGKKGVTDRIALLSTDMVGARLHYKEHYFICQSKWKTAGGIETCSEEAVCCKQLGEPRKRFIVPILKYATKQDGSPLTDIGAFQLMAWKFSEDKFILLRASNNDFPLDQFDILVTCTEERWQKLSIQVLPKTPMRRHEKWPKEYTEAAEAFVESSKKKLPRLLGRKKTMTELLEILGLASPEAETTSDVPLADVDDILKDLG